MAPTGRKAGGRFCDVGISRNIADFAIARRKPFPLKSGYADIMRLNLRMLGISSSALK